MRNTLIALAGWLAAIVPAGFAPAQQKDAGSIVYYQITYADGEVRDRFSPPESDEKVVSVVRIARVDSPLPQRTMVSSEVGMVSFNQPKVYRNDMKWDGQAWRIAGDEAGDKPDAQKLMQQALLEEYKRILTETLEIEKGLDKARQVLEDARTLQREDLSAAAAEAARRQLDRAEQNVQSLEKRKQELLSAAKAFADLSNRLQRPTGKLTSPGDAPPANRGWGIGRQLGTRSVRPYRTQLWPLPPGQGLRRYRVSMAHTAAGMLGSFCFLVYADTDEDGRPDQLVGCSPLAIADQAGHWSGWTFQSDAKRLFVGNTWPDPRASVYSGRLPEADRGKSWHGLGGEVWVSGFFGGLPERRFTPYITNLRVELIPPDARD
jgi:hypothetical protein